MLKPVAKILGLAVLAVLAVSASAASAALISSGVADLAGTRSFDFDTGTQGSFTSDSGQDAWWQQVTSTRRRLVPTNGAQIVNLGTITFATLTQSALEGLSYGSAPIVGNDVGNMLTFGNVFAVKTTDGNYAKVLVSAPFFDATNNNGLIFYYETYSPAVPEPGSIALTLAGVGIAGWVARRRKPLLA